jgi:hypothetical protein
VYALSENSVAGNPLLLIEFSGEPGYHELCKLLSILTYCKNYSVTFSYYLFIYLFIFLFYSSGARI